MKTHTKRDDLKPDSKYLERRVLAHERILQSLIAYMSHSEARFVDTMSMARREQDYRDFDDYAEEFIQAVTKLEESCACPTSKVAKSEAAATRPLKKLVLGSIHVPPPRSEPGRVRERNEILEVRVDGALLGNYQKSKHARTATPLARLSLK